MPIGETTGVLQFRATNEERAMIEKAAKKEGVTVAEFCRNAIYFDLITRGNKDAFKLLAKHGSRAVKHRLAGLLGNLGWLAKGTMVSKK